MPSANRLTVGIMAMVAEEEGRAISKRTKKALAAAKRRGTVLGGYRGAKITRRIREAGNDAQRRLAKRRAVALLPIIKELKGDGATSLKDVADGLNARNIPTAHGGKWQPTQVMRVLARQ
jgi:DNA invertase Pin-like site-specific DNA recombinase